MRRVLVAVVLVALAGCGRGVVEEPAAPFVTALVAEGREPVGAVGELLQVVDLLIFDDGVHTAVEPFRFYERLLRTPEVRGLVDFVFLEAVPINRQPALDAYLAAEEDDPSLLYPAFQDDYSGLGFPLRSYFDLLRTVREVNRGLPEKARVRVVAVSNPTWWCEVRSAADVANFRRSLTGRDYDMYRVILDEMEGFGSGRKGLFLTNTRHAYKDVRRADGTPFWNTGTFFHRWHTGHTYSIRFHAPALFVEAEREPEAGEARSTAGMERYSYRWGRLADGAWDEAFAARDNRPVVVPLVGNAFGATPYVGNHMHQAAPDQTMSDAYDAVIFLTPLEEQRKTATVGEIYTPEFQREVVRRMEVLYTPEQLSGLLEAEGVETVEEYVAMLAAGEDEADLDLIR